VASNGTSSGILLMWDRRVVSKIDVCIGSFVVACSFRNVEDGVVWAFAGVYGPTRNNFRRLLWEELAGVMSLWDMPWYIGGDFNVTIFHSERLGGARMRRAVTDFAEFTMDLPLAAGCLCGPTPFHGLDWIGFWSLRNGSCATQVWFRRRFFACAPITHLFF
jgi:hypothetical protein